ncbi:MAG: hypothetical protein V1798_04145 [Pseudomonadota bacterium]
MTRFAWIWAILVATAPVAVSAGELGAVGALQSHPMMLRKLLDWSGDRSKLADIVLQAERDKLPAQKLLQKAVEGISKGAPPPRVLAAVQRLDARLRRADIVVRHVTKHYAPKGSRKTKEMALVAVADSLRGRRAPETVLKKVQLRLRATQPANWNTVLETVSERPEGSMLQRTERPSEGWSQPGLNQPMATISPSEQ